MFTFPLVKEDRKRGMERRRERERRRREREEGARRGSVSAGYSDGMGGDRGSQEEEEIEIEGGEEMQIAMMRQE